MGTTMSNSRAPMRARVAASCRRVETSEAPKGKPMTAPTGIPVPESIATAVETHSGFTMAHAKRYRIASSQRLSTCSRVASGFKRVWSITAASACQWASVCLSKGS